VIEDDIEEDISYYYREDEKQKAPATDNAAAVDAVTVPEETEMTSINTSMALEPQEELDTRDKLIADAALHVKQAADQHQLCNEKIKEAEDDLAANKSHAKSCRVIVCNYSQNANCPQTGDSQAGETFYLSALICNIFGIVDATIKGGSLDAWVYHEG